MYSIDRKTAAGVFGAALCYLSLLTGLLGAYPGHNYDSYQYAYAAVRGPLLSSASLAEFSRMHVHAGYYPLWRALVATGLPAWAAFTWLNVLTTALTAGLVYSICRTLQVGRLLAALAGAFFLSSTSVAYYASIPEVYSPWMLFLALFIWAMLVERPNLASVAYALSLWMFLQSLLLWPLFWLVGQRKCWRHALAGLLFGGVLHMGTLSFYGIPFLPRLAGETVYFRVITGWQWFFSSTWNTLSLAGVLWAALLYLALAVHRRKDELLRRLEIMTAPTLLAPAIWVKDHGSFFLPFVLLLTLLGTVMLCRWSQNSRSRSLAALLLVGVLLASNVRTTWGSLEYDRNAGTAQMIYCRSALGDMPENSRVLSTALLSTWLWACEETGRTDVACEYFPWMLRPDYGPVLQASLQGLMQRPGTYYVDSSVSSLVSEAGRVICTWLVDVPGWPNGILRWPLQVVDIGER